MDRAAAEPSAFRRQPSVRLHGCACLLALAVTLSSATASAQAGASDPRAQAATTHGFSLRLGAGVGVGQRSVVVPTRLGDRLLDSAAFPALGIDLEGGGVVGAHAVLGVRFHYQTSVALKAKQEPAAGSGKETSLRLHHVEVGITPGLRFRASPGGSVLRLFAGWGFRGLRAVRDIAIPAYMLHGPLLRPELRIPFSDSVAELRLAPELQIITGISADLRELAATASNGVAWGGEIALSVRLARALRLHIDYRESHARIGSAWGRPVSDVARFAIVGIDMCY